MSKRLVYKSSSGKSKIYPASNCVFATQGYNDEEISIFMDGNLDVILKMMTALFSALDKQSRDAAFYYVEACMKLLAEKVGLTPEDIEEESILMEEENNDD